MTAPVFSFNLQDERLKNTIGNLIWWRRVWHRSPSFVNDDFLSSRLRTLVKPKSTYLGSCFATYGTLFRLRFCALIPITARNDKPGRSRHAVAEETLRISRTPIQQSV